MKCNVYENVVPKKINLGAGCDYKEGYLGVDRKNWDGHIDIICNFEKEKLPFRDNSLDEIFCAHVLEHLSNPDDVIMECHRILKKGGLFHITVPYFQLGPANVFCHKNFWSIACLNLFDGTYFEFGKWSKVDWDVNFANRNGLKQKILKPLIMKYPSIYEGHFASIFPVAEIQFKLIK